MKKQPKPPKNLRTVSVWVRGIPSSDRPKMKFMLLGTYATKAAAKARLQKGEVLVNLRGIYARPSLENSALEK